MRRLLCSVALLAALAAPAFAQSDARWMAVFYASGVSGFGSARTTGNGDGGDAAAMSARGNHIVQTMLDRMGVPRRYFSIPDTANWWHLLGENSATAHYGVADSVRFRQAGAFGWVSVAQNNSGTTELGKFFRGPNSGVPAYAASPPGGGWGIPGAFFVQSAVATSGQTTGMFDIGGPSGSPRVKQVFTTAQVPGIGQAGRIASGDSISILAELVCIIAAAESSDVTPIININTSSIDSGYVAWRYKTSAYYYLFSSSPYLIQAPFLLGIADVFRAAGYRPRRKLNLHMTLDHVFPDFTVRTVPSDSFFVYVDGMNLRFSGSFEANRSETANQNRTVSSGWRSRAARWPSHPHSHNVLNFSTQFWNVAFTDTATKRARWNDLQRAIVSDSIGLQEPQGYEKTAAFPNNSVYFPDLYIPAGAGFTDIRSWWTSLDSVGQTSRASTSRFKVNGPRQYTDPITSYGLPYYWQEPKTGRGLYVHDAAESPNSADSVATSATEYTADIAGFSALNLDIIARCIIWDADWYWHPDNNLRTNAGLMDPFMRRFQYFYGRVSNIVSIDPAYRNRTPRNSNTAR